MKEKTFQLASILILLALSYYVVYVSGGTSRVYVHLFYIPIIISARYFSPIRGGVLAGVISGILCGPFMPLNRFNNTYQSWENWSLRLLIFVMAGWFIEFLYRKLANQLKQVTKQNQLLNFQNDEVVKKNHEIMQKNEEIEIRNQEINLKNQEIQSQHQLIMEQKSEIEQISTELLTCLAEAIAVRDPFTNGHCRRVGKMAYEVGRHLNLSENDLMELRWSGIIHDIGKIGIPESILTKAGKLTDFEYDVIKQHPNLGKQIISSSRFATKVMDGVLHHHERLDGSGYPEGLRGEEIGIQAKILAVCDVWDALTSDRPYRNEMDKETARKILEEGRGKYFDPEILDIFLDVITEKTFK